MMKHPILKITITGAPATGKTRLANAIKDYIKEQQKDIHNGDCKVAILENGKYYGAIPIEEHNYIINTTTKE